MLYNKYDEQGALVNQLEAENARLKEELAQSENLRKGIESGMDCAYAEAVRLREQLAAAQLDAARLNWIERQDFDDLSFTVFRDQPNDGMYGVSVTKGWCVGDTFRAAIDSAMKGEQP